MFDVFYAGVKPNLFAHEQAVDSIEQAEELSRTRFFWFVNYLSDYSGFDFLWEPKPWEGHQRHAWPSQHQPDSGTYLVPKRGYTETNYNKDVAVARLSSNDNWHIPDNIDIKTVDFTWHPNPLDPLYIYHFPSQHQSSSGVTYTVPGATEIKLIDAFVVKTKADMANWHLSESIDESKWDWSWHPNPTDPPYIYVFGNQHWPAELHASVTYTVPGATEIKYMDTRTVRLPHPKLFGHNLAVSKFDYSWMPNPYDPPMTYVWGNQWNPAVLEPTVVYNAGGTEIKYMDDQVATIAQDITPWELLDEIVDFDYSWRPNPTDPPYIYVFGNQWMNPEQRPALRYVVPGATEIKYMDEPKAKRVGSPEKFITHADCDFDYSWEPDPHSPPYKYVFGNQHWPANIMPTVEYHVAGATEVKFMSEPVATLKSKPEDWATITDLPLEFDYSWVPDPGDPPYIYVFGNQWYDATVMPTVEYHVEGATTRKFVDTIKAKLLPVMDRWSIPEEIAADNVDFSWAPHPKDDPYIHHFGTDYQMSVGLTYTVPGATELKFEGLPPVKIKDKKVVNVLDMFFIDKSNQQSASRYAALQEKYPHIQKTRFANSTVDTIKRCASKSKTSRFWVLSSDIVYDEFDFEWHPNTWQNYMTHVFGSQWNKWSDTFLVNKWEFERHAKWAKNIEDFPNLHFVQNQQVSAPADAHDIYVIEHGPSPTRQYLEGRYRVVRSARYFDNYLDTLRRLLAGVEAEHVWVVSSLCDYSRFDFSWQPEAWQRNMLHVFPSNEQKFGDTFFVPVAALREKINEIELLDWFETVNYCSDQTVPRWPMPVIQHNNDTHVAAVLASNFVEPLALFTTRSVDTSKLPTVSIWREKTKTIVPLDPGACSVIVPKNSISAIKTQLYDYLHIDKTKRNIFNNELQDVIFISNGEPMAEDNWNTLRQLCPRAKHSQGVQGREAAYKAAANMSETPWFFAVFAKTEVLPDFKFDFQPDRLQAPKHYIFHSRNPLNGLEYGAMNINLYNRHLVLNTVPGIDFTLSAAHEVVPICASISRFNTDPWITWRSAFREVLKLKQEVDQGAGIEIQYRLDRWCTYAEGENADHCLQGSRDALAYYQSVNGDYDSLKLSFDWAWLQDYYYKKYNQQPWLEVV